MIEQDVEKANLTLVNGQIVDKSTGEILVASNSVELDEEELGFNTEGMSLGQKLDTIFDLKMEIETLEDQVKIIKSEYEFIQREILTEMADKDLDKIECSRGSATYKVEPFPNIKNHMAFFEWVAETKRFEFLEKRCSRSAIKDMLSTDGLLPPGIDTYQKESISIRKKPVRRSK